MLHALQFQHVPGQLVNLLRVAVEDSLDVGIRQVAVITFKNAVKKDWDPLGAPLTSHLAHLAHISCVGFACIFAVFSGQSSVSYIAIYQDYTARLCLRVYYYYLVEDEAQTTSYNGIQRGPAPSQTATRRRCGTTSWRASCARRRWCARSWASP